MTGVPPQTTQNKSNCEARHWRVPGPHILRALCACVVPSARRLLLPVGIRVCEAKHCTAAATRAGR